MPAKSKAQLRKAFAMRRRGQDGWAKELIEKTHTTKGLPQHKTQRKNGKKK